MPDEKMENKIFDQIIGDKMRSAEQEEVKPQWPKMKRLLWANGLRGVSGWYYFLFGALALSIALNTVFIIGKQDGTTIDSTKISNHNISKNNVAFIKRDTIVITDTVYVHKVIYQKQFSALSTDDGLSLKETDKQVYTKPSDKNNKSTEGQIEESVTLDNTKAVLVYKDRRIKKTVNQKDESLNMVSSTNSEKTATPVKNKKSSVVNKNKAPDTQQISYNTAESESALLTKRRKKKKPLVVHFNLGVGFEPAFITTKGVTGYSVGYGFIPEIRLSKRLAFYTGFWFIAQKFKFEDGLSDYSYFSTEISDPSKVEEVHTTNNILKIPLGIKVYIPLKERFTISWSGAINYLHYYKQDFEFDIKIPDDSHQFLSKNNTYSGFGSVSTGLGASYIWRDKLAISISPEVEIPLAKLGAEKIKYKYFITQFTVSWHF